MIDMTEPEARRKALATFAPQPVADRAEFCDLAKDVSRSVVAAAVDLRREFVADDNAPQSRLQDLDGVAFARAKRQLLEAIDNPDLRMDAEQFAVVADGHVLIALPLPWGDEFDSGEEFRPRALIMPGDFARCRQVVARERARRRDAVEAHGRRLREEERKRIVAEREAREQRERLAARYAVWDRLSPLARVALGAAASQPAGSTERRMFVELARSAQRDGLPDVDPEIEEFARDIGTRWHFVAKKQQEG